MSGDLLGSLSRRKQRHRLFLARRKRCEPAAKYLQASPLQTCCVISLDTASHRVEQCLVFEGLGKEVHGPSFHRSNRRPYVVLVSKKNQGRLLSGLCQSELKIEAANAR
jgi:hypothetical protein